MGKDDAEEMLNANIDEKNKQIEKLTVRALRIDRWKNLRFPNFVQADLATCKDKMAKLKVQLYGRFGNSINLEED